MSDTSNYKHIYLLPGIDGTGLLFKPLASAFGYRCRTTALSFQEEITLDDFIESASRQMPDHRALVLAESFSGPIALGLLAKYPGRFQAAILSSTFARSPFNSFLGMNALIPKNLFGNVTLSNLLLNRFCAGSEISGSVKDLVEEVSGKIPPLVVKKRLHILDTFDVRPLLSRISTPILYLAGLKDKLVSAGLRAELFENIPRICFKGVDGPHLLLQSKATVCADTIMNFLELEDSD